MPRRRARPSGSWLLCGALAVLACQDLATTATNSRPQLEPTPDEPVARSEPEPTAGELVAHPPPSASAKQPRPDGAAPALKPPDVTPPVVAKSTDAAPDVTYSPGPLDATAVDRGVLVVWSRHDDDTDKSDLLAVLLDERGIVQDAPRLVRRTSGQILDLAVHRRDGAAWLVWIALLGETPRPRALVAALQLEPDLSGVHPPITLDQFSDEDMLSWADRELIRVRDLASGHAAVAAVAAPTRCTDIVTDRATPCSGFSLAWVHQDGSVIRAGHAGADGGDPDIGSLIDVGTGVLFDTWAWHGGATFSTMFARYDQAVHPVESAQPGGAPFDIVHCRPPFTRMWTGAQLVTLCPNEYADEGQRCKHLGFEETDGDCHRIHVASSDRRSVTPRGRNPTTPMTFYKERCVGDHPVVDVRWAGGKLLVDPRAPGASFDLDIGVWTGRHAIAIDPDGSRGRWNCTKGGFELDGGLDDAFPHDPRDPRPVPAAVRP